MAKADRHDQARGTAAAPDAFAHRPARPAPKPAAAAAGERSSSGAGRRAQGAGRRAQGAGRRAGVCRAGVCRLPQKPADTPVVRSRQAGRGGHDEGQPSPAGPASSCQRPALGSCSRPKKHQPYCPGDRPLLRPGVGFPLGRRRPGLVPRAGEHYGSIIAAVAGPIANAAGGLGNPVIATGAGVAGALTWDGVGRSGRRLLSLRRPARLDLGRFPCRYRPGSPAWSARRRPLSEPLPSPGEWWPEAAGLRVRVETARPIGPSRARLSEAGTSKAQPGPRNLDAVLAAGTRRAWPSRCRRHRRRRAAVSTHRRLPTTDLGAVDRPARPRRLAPQSPSTERLTLHNPRGDRGASPPRPGGTTSRSASSHRHRAGAVASGTDGRGPAPNSARPGPTPTARSTLGLSAHLRRAGGGLCSSPRHGTSSPAGRVQPGRPRADELARRQRHVLTTGGAASWPHPRSVPGCGRSGPPRPPTASMPPAIATVASRVGGRHSDVGCQTAGALSPRESTNGVGSPDIRRAGRGAARREAIAIEHRQGQPLGSRWGAGPASSVE
jgi:hypothetical protein